MGIAVQRKLQAPPQNHKGRATMLRTSEPKYLAWLTKIEGLYLKKKVAGGQFSLCARPIIQERKFRTSWPRL